jgi:hypothetical protein
MLPIFSAPFALFGLLAVPALAAIYWLRSRSKPLVVSSLMLWMHEREDRGGGRQVKKSPFPLSFYIEALALALLCLALAQPKLPTNSNRLPLVIVLDDSFSMLAGDVRPKALAAVESEVEKGGFKSVRFVLAGAAPNTTDLENYKTAWTCGAATSNLAEAVSFAFALEANKCRVLVVTDHAPPTEMAKEFEASALEWRAYGVPHPNFAIVTAARSAGLDGKDRVLLEIANLSAEAGTTALAVGGGAGQPIRLDAKEIRRVTYAVPAKDVFSAKLSPDQLALDDTATLLPLDARPVRVSLSIATEPTRTLFEKGLQATDNVRLDAAAPELVITDNPAGESATGWTVVVQNEPSAASFVGPFVLNRTHPLTEGLSLTGTVWGAGNGPVGGTPVVLAGNTPIVTDTERPDGRHLVTFKFRPELSTLQNTPNFPILLANLVAWRGGTAPGARPINARLGMELAVNLPVGVSEIEVKNPEGQTRKLAGPNGRATVNAEKIGVYDLRAGTETYRVAVNALAKDESDLSTATRGTWGNWSKAVALEREYTPIGWLFLIAALGVLAWHAARISSNR